MKISFSPGSERMALIADDKGTYLRAISVMEGFEMASLRFPKEPIRFFLNSEGNMAVVQEDGNPSRVALWPIKGAASPLKYLTSGHLATALNFTAHSGIQRVAVCEKGSSGRHTIQLYSLQTGDHIITRDLPGKIYNKLFLWFSNNGQYILINTFDDYDDNGRYLLLSAADLLPVDFAPNEGLRALASSSRELLLAWPTPNHDAKILHFGSKSPRIIRGLSLESIPGGILTNRAANKLVIAKKSGTVELWNIASGERVKELELNDRAKWMTFSLEEKALLITTEGGHNYLYDTSTGRKIASMNGMSTLTPIVYYAECGKLNAWDTDGRVLQYTKGIKIPLVPFLQTANCP
jgi:WD40 repeat protein